MQSSVIDTVQRTIRKHNMLAPGDSVLVGLSGGADSVCLLHCLASLKKRLGIQLYAAHLNHGIRGKEADGDQHFAQNLCEKLDVPFYTEKVDVPALAKSEGVSEETAGRLARYRYFARLCHEHNITKTATAHNQNDQAETVLMRIIRGTGTDGMSGIRYCRRDGVIRPLLDVKRADIEEYCTANGLSYCTDSTNNEESYTRNRIRKKLIPMLAEEFNPNITETLAVLSQNVSQDAEFINGYTSRLYKRINNPAPKKKPVVLDIQTLKMVDESIRTRLIRLAITDAMGREYKPERTHITAINELIDKETGTEINLPRGLTAAVKYGWLAFETDSDREKLRERIQDNLSVEVSSEGIYKFGNYTITLETADGGKPKKGQLKLDYDKIKDMMPLVIRNRKDGDRFSVFKDGRNKKLKSFMIDEKIPADERNGIPLLCSGNNVIAVIGRRAAEPYKADKNTKRGLVITYETTDFCG